MEGYSNLGNWKHFTAKFIPFFENNIYMYTPKAGTSLPLDTVYKEGFLGNDFLIS